MRPNQTYVSMIVIVAFQFCAAAAAQENGDPSSNDQIERLIENLRKKDDQENSVKELIKIGARAIPNLTKALNDTDPTFRKAVVETLGLLGPKAKDSVTSIFDAVKKHNELWLSAADAVGHIGKEAIPSIIDAIRQDDESIRLLALYAFALMNCSSNDNVDVGIHAKDAVPKLKEYLGSPKKLYVALETDSKTDDLLLRTGIIRLLGFIGPDALEAVSSLKTASSYEEGKLYEAATAAIKRIEAKK